MFALVMSTLNFSGLMSSQLGGILIDMLGITDSQFKNLWLLVLLANLLQLVPLPLIVFVDF
jgi:hypothetical protein